MYCGRIPKYLYFLACPQVGSRYNCRKGLFKWSMEFSIFFFPNVCLDLSSFTVAILDSLLAQLSHIRIKVIINWIVLVYVLMVFDRPILTALMCFELSYYHICFWFLEYRSSLQSLCTIKVNKPKHRQCTLIKKEGEEGGCVCVCRIISFQFEH